MTVATASNGELEHIRVIVYREGDVYVAQCLEHDIATQGRDIPTALERLDLTIDAECAISKEAGGQAFDNIPSAPNYFHALWDKRSMTLTHVKVPVGHHYKMEVALAAWTVVAPFGGHPTLERLVEWLSNAGCKVELKQRNHSITGQPYQSLEITSPVGSRAVLVNPDMNEHLAPSMVSYFQRRLGMRTPFPAESEQPSNVVEFVPVPDTDDDSLES